MSASRRSGRNDGCWTCKLRRKKCDEGLPTCENCDSLEITCNYGPKPAWMDGGVQQRQMSENLKNEIKRNAAYRREKANSSSRVSRDDTTHLFNIMPNIMVPNNILSHEPMDSAMSGDQPLTPGTPGGNSATSHRPPPLTMLPYIYQGISVEQCPAIELDFIMKYLDFAFPTLFPFYRPALFETGRSWLLLLIGKSKIAYHATVSLSCYFFTMALTDASSPEDVADCKQMRWEEVEQQANKCFDSLRAEMSALDLSTESGSSTTLERVELMASVTQVLIFEMTLGKSAPWNSHLPAAYALFKEIMACSSTPSQHQGQSRLSSVLLDLGQPLWSRRGQCSKIWSPEQAGFRYCAGFLIYVDVLASTVIQKPPSLLEYHEDILNEADEDTSVVDNVGIRLSSIFGCRNWIIRSIAEISALESWKRDQIKSNSLSIKELDECASAITTTLRNGILDIQSLTTAGSSPPINRCLPFDLLPHPSASIQSTLIWAYGAQLYLTVVVSGWQLSNTEVRTNVTKILELLHTVPSYQLRSLAWPLCVAGCLALESEESSFTALFASESKLHMAGMLDNVRQILVHVWQIRTTLEAKTWNLASCFSILGSPILIA